MIMIEFDYTFLNVAMFTRMGVQKLSFRVSATDVRKMIECITEALAIIEYVDDNYHEDELMKQKFHDGYIIHRTLHNANFIVNVFERDNRIYLGSNVLDLTVDEMTLFRDKLNNRLLEEDND